MTTTLHLVREMHDVIAEPVSIWCEASSWYSDHSSTTQSMDMATCRDCLKAAVEYGIEAAQRLAALPVFTVKRE